jgi:hypothetical protein
VLKLVDMAKKAEATGSRSVAFFVGVFQPFLRGDD